MNIFATSACAYESAKALDDKRVIKMILESCQLLNTALVHDYGIEHSMGYKPTHVNHPCAVWVRASIENYIWLCYHLDALCEEYTARYNKVHACQQYVKHFFSKRDLLPSKRGPFKFVNCTTDFKAINDTCLAYQMQLAKKWNEDKRAPTWYGDTAGYPDWRLTSEGANV